MFYGQNEINKTYWGCSINIDINTICLIMFIAESFNINPSNMLTGSHKNQTKKTIVDTAKDLPAYFSRIFPVYVSTSFTFKELAIQRDFPYQGATYVP